jgi:hypothetical protein
MTGFAFLRHRALVRLGMAGAAVSLIRHVGTDLVTGRTILSQGSVFSLEGKPGLSGMLETFQVERPDIDIGALMLLVAGLAIPGDLAMNTFLGGDSVGDRLMAGQAAVGVDLLAVGVAFPAIRFSLQRTVRLGERTGSRKLSLRILPGEGEKGDQKQAADPGRKGEERGRKESFRTIGYSRPARRHPQSFHDVRFSRVNPYNSYNKYNNTILETDWTVHRLEAASPTRTPGQYAF